MEVLNKRALEEIKEEKADNHRKELETKNKSSKLIKYVTEKIGIKNFAHWDPFVLNEYVDAEWNYS